MAKFCVQWGCGSDGDGGKRSACATFSLCSFFFVDAVFFCYAWNENLKDIEDYGQIFIYQWMEKDGGANHSKRKYFHISIYMNLSITLSETSWSWVCMKPSFGERFCFNLSATCWVFLFHLYTVWLNFFCVRSVLFRSAMRKVSIESLMRIHPSQWQIKWKRPGGMIDTRYLWRSLLTMVCVCVYEPK